MPSLLRRIALEVAREDAEPAGALLADIAAVPAVLEQRPRSRRATASVYLPKTWSTRVLREVRGRLNRLAREGVLRGAMARSEAVIEQDWAQSWKRFFPPSHVAENLWITPAWRKTFEPLRNEKTLVLEPGMAFGTGQHLTTRVALALLLARVTRGDVVIDAGCGSGVLGIAAAQQGADVYAFDSDPIAVRATRENFKRNALQPAALVKAAGIPKSFPRADVIVANIDEAVLADLAKQFAEKLARGGLLFSAGITARGRLPLLARYVEAGLHFINEVNHAEWFAYVHAK
jgi:ribosomal protein L11 methyltransferase